MCRLNSDGRSNAFPQTSHGNIFLLGVKLLLLDDEFRNFCVVDVVFDVKLYAVLELELLNVVVVVVVVVAGISFFNEIPL